MMRVLFVDDEQRILDGLRRMLRSQRKEWDMEFALGGEAALEAMRQQPFDVVVSDMKMPGMNGAELLTRVSLEYPETVRIILSGQADKDAIMQAIPVTHQYLAKPCEPDVIRDIITRTFALQQSMNSSKLKALVSQMDGLPSLPSLYAELSEEINNDNASMARVGAIVSKDLGMSAKILKLVNSAFFGLRREVTSVDRAVAFLGLETIGSLVIGIQVFKQFEGAQIPAFSLEALWSHSLRTAHLSKAIGKLQQLDKEELDVTFMAGMLHDAGKLILATNVPQEYQKAFEMVERDGMRVGDAEREVLGVTHAEVGAYMFGIWGLPSPLVEAVAYHVHPAESPATEFGMLGIVHVADAVARTPDVADPSAPDFPVDWAYLEEKGVADRWPEWQEGCLEVLGAEAAA